MTHDRSGSFGENGGNNDARKRWWSEIDIWSVALALLILAILALVTFEVWIPHPFSHR